MNKLKYPKFTAVVPVYNEASRFPHVVKELLKIKELEGLILVDDGSSDNSPEAASQFKADTRFHFIQHKKNKGKGVALKTGLQKAKSEIILFLDGDLENISYQKIRKIVMPVLQDEVDVSRGAFRRARGRVTEYAVKPMMRILFPEMYFEQPISGQVCAKKEFLGTVDLETNYGVDIGILFDAIQSGQRIKEVDIGWLEHKANTEANITKMSEQVLETMIKKAGLIHHKYNLVIFTLDETLIPSASIQNIFKKLAVDVGIAKNQEMLDKDKIGFDKFLISNARLFSGISSEKIIEVCKDATLAKYAQEVISALKKRKYQVAIISSNYSPIVAPLAKRLGVSIYSSVELIEKNGLLTGDISQHSKDRWMNGDIESGFEKAMASAIRKAGVKASQTIMVANSKRSIPIMKSAGLSIAYRPKSSELKEVADKTISVLAEILAIIE